MRDRIIQLQESAEELGFGTIQQALDAGYHEVQDLVNNTFKLEKVEDLTNRAYREAHEAWEKEKNIVLGDLMNLLVHQVYDHDIIERAYKFIKEQCHE